MAGCGVALDALGHELERSPRTSPRRHWATAVWGGWDGANIEMAEHIGAEHIYIFGLRTDEVEAIAEGRFSRHRVQFAPIVDALLNSDTYFVLAYVASPARISPDYRDPQAWGRKRLLNIARMDHFSSDRTIREYADGIWHV